MNLKDKYLVLVFAIIILIVTGAVFVLVRPPYPTTLKDEENTLQHFDFLIAQQANILNWFGIVTTLFLAAGALIAGFGYFTSQRISESEKSVTQANNEIKLIQDKFKESEITIQNLANFDNYLNTIKTQINFFDLPIEILTKQLDPATTPTLLDQYTKIILIRGAGKQIDDEGYLIQAIYFYHLQDYNSAKEFLKLVTASPTSRLKASYHYLLGNINLKINEKVEAELDYLKTINIQRYSTSTYYNLLHLYSESNDYVVTEINFYDTDIPLYELPTKLQINIDNHITSQHKSEIVTHLKLIWNIIKDGEHQIDSSDAINLNDLSYNYFEIKYSNIEHLFHNSTLPSYLASKLGLLMKAQLDILFSQGNQENKTAAIIEYQDLVIEIIKSNEDVKYLIDLNNIPPSQFTQQLNKK